MIAKIINIVKDNPKVSDFHLRANCPFSYRLLGEIVILEGEMIKNEDIENLLNKYCSKSDVELFNRKNELDSGFMLENMRFRANFYKTLKGPAVVLRKVETAILNMDSLNLPPVMYSIVDMHKGLVLVTGPTGSGKSTRQHHTRGQKRSDQPGSEHAGARSKIAGGCRCVKMTRPMRQ